MIIALVLLFFIGAVIAAAGGIQAAMHNHGQSSGIYLNDFSFDAFTSQLHSESSLRKLGYFIGILSLIGIIALTYIPVNLTNTHSFVGMADWQIAQVQQPATGGTIPSPTTQSTASQKLIRIGQVDTAGFDAAEYITPAQQTDWQYSDCSTAAMTEVINAYGHTYKIGDILNTEIQKNAITINDGLLSPDGITNTVAVYGFKTVLGQGSMSYTSLITLANQGTPVIVGFPPALYPGGHIVVVTGGSTTNVNLADSSIYNRQTVTYTWFMQHWGGFTAVVTPQ